MNKAVFLDRDGTINVEVNNLKDIKSLKLLPKAAESIRILNKNKYLVVVITNQSVVARGWITEKGLRKIHETMQKRLAKKHARIDAIYYCPHHPEADLEKYRKDCSDRKPNIGLIKKAQKDLNISLQKSFLIGDTTRDIKTAKNAGISSILVKTGYGGKDGKFNIVPDFTAKNLHSAVLYILNIK